MLLSAGYHMWMSQMSKCITLCCCFPEGTKTVTYGGLAPTKTTVWHYVFRNTPQNMMQMFFHHSWDKGEEDKTYKMAHMFKKRPQACSLSSVWGSKTRHIPLGLIGDIWGSSCLLLDLLSKDVCQMFVYFFHVQAKESNSKTTSTTVSCGQYDPPLK